MMNISMSKETCILKLASGDAIFLPLFQNSTKSSVLADEKFSNANI